MGQAAYAKTWMFDNTEQSPRERLVDPNVTSDQKTYALLIHLSLLATHFVPFALVLAPLIMWQIRKGDSPFLDDHGREAVNFQLSLLLYGVGLALLSVITCGFGAIGFIPLYILALVGMILGAVAANRGEYFRYPATMRLI